MPRGTVRGENILAPGLAIAAMRGYINRVAPPIPAGPTLGLSIMVKETEQETESKAVATHELLNAAGESPDGIKEEDAVGIRYTLLGNKQAVQVMWADLSPDAQRMAGLFGLKTRFTNDTSGVRNQKRNGVKPFEFDYDSQIAAVRETLDDLNKTPPVWTGEREGGPRVNLDVLADAICAFLVADGKRTQAEIESNNERARQLGKLNDEKTGKAYVASCRLNPGIAAQYAAMTGRKVATTDDLLA
jgi:hypothetical protein